MKCCRTAVCRGGMSSCQDGRAMRLAHCWYGTQDPQASRTVHRSPPAPGLEIHASFGTVSGTFLVELLSELHKPGTHVVQLNADAACWLVLVTPATIAAPAGPFCSLGVYGIRSCRPPCHPLLSAYHTQSRVTTPSDTPINFSVVSATPPSRRLSESRGLGIDMPLGTRSGLSAPLLRAVGCRDSTLVPIKITLHNDRVTTNSVLSSRRSFP